MPLFNRPIHKLSINLQKYKSYVRCTGMPDFGLQRVTFFWKDVSCPKCKEKKKALFLAAQGLIRRD